LKKIMIMTAAVILALLLVSCDLNITIKDSAPPLTTAGDTTASFVTSSTDPGPGDTTSGSLPEATTAKPEATTVLPDVTTAVPEVTTALPEVTTSEPEVTTKEAEQTTEAPPAETTSGEPHEHNYTKVEKVNGQFHVKTCDCGHAETEAHKFTEWTLIKPPTEFEEGENYRQCTVCGYSEKSSVPKLDHEHQFSGEWEFDSTGHFKRCACGVSDSVSPHTFGGWTVTLEPTETSEGTKERVCSVCGYTETAVVEKLSHVHSFSDDWKKDTTYHWHECSCGEIGSKGMHTGSWVTSVEPTSTSAGERIYTCTVCGFTITETIPALPLEGVSGTLTHNVHSNGYTRLVLKYETVSRTSTLLTLKCTMYLNCYTVHIGTRDGTLRLGDSTVAVNTAAVDKDYVQGQRADLYLAEAVITMPLTNGKGSAQISFTYNIAAVISGVDISSVTVSGTVVAD
jgi:rubredoxin